MSIILNALGRAWQLPDRKEFGALLRAIREDRLLSVNEMARRTGLHPYSIRSVEDGDYFGLAWTIVEAYAGLGTLSRESLLEGVTHIGIGIRLQRFGTGVVPVAYAPYLSEAQKVRVRKAYRMGRGDVPPAFRPRGNGSLHKPGRRPHPIKKRSATMKKRRKASPPKATAPVPTRVRLKMLVEVAGSRSESVSTLQLDGKEFDIDSSLCNELESAINSYRGMTTD